LSAGDSFLAAGFLTMLGTILLAELTDKDALLLLSLATKMKPLVVFAAGAVAFTITSAVIVVIGSALVSVVPILWIKLAGGVIMLGYALLEYYRGLRIEKNLEDREQRFAKSVSKTELYAFLGILASLIVLDLAGDATELITIVFVAQYRNVLLVFSAAVLALVTASAIETALGNRLGKFLSAARVRQLSIVVFLLIGSVIILTSGIVAL
jgi:putative Ca2+/H+ antiporter (TMEM165/GDT1 family)